MKMIKNLIPVCFALLFTSACTNDAAIETNDALCPQILVDPSLYTATQSGPATSIMDAVVTEEDCIKLTLGYGGGCDEHDIMLVTDGIYIKTNPPQIHVRLSHDNTDLCEAYITDIREFDLTELKYENNDQLLVLVDGTDFQFLMQF